MVEPPSDLHVLVVRHLVGYEHVRPFSAGHVEYLNRNYARGVFLASGQADDPNDGGAIIACGVSREALAEIIEEDPYVREGVSVYHVLSVEPRTDVVAGAEMRVLRRSAAEPDPPH